MEQCWTAAAADRAVGVLVRAALVMAAAAGGVVGTAAPVVADPVPGYARATQAAWTWPLKGTPVLVRPFLAPPEPWLAGHRGVDLAATPGSPVLAAGAGTVTFAGRVAGRGVVVVRHGALRTTYEPVRALVAVGAAVRAGSRLGTLSVDEGHCPPRACLHWGLRRGETYLDPLLLVRRPALRLLPLTGSPHPRERFPGAPAGLRAAPRSESAGDGSVTPLLSLLSYTGNSAATQPAGLSTEGAVPRGTGRWAALLLALLALRAARAGARTAGRSPSARCRPPPTPGRSPAPGMR
jgi:hypothetical protein